MGDRIDRLAKIGGILGVSLYVIGFAVVSVHDTAYGFVTFNAFRAKLIGAGLAFGVLFAVGVVSGARVYGRFGFKASSELQIEKSTRFERLVYRFSHLSMAAWTLTFGFQFLLADNPFRWSHIALFLGYFLVKSMPGVWTEERLHQSPQRFLVALFLSDVGFLALVTSLNWLAPVWFYAWFLMAETDATTIGDVFEKKVDLQQNDLQFYVFTMLSLFGIFGIGLYPLLPAKFGGGELTQISFQFADGAKINKSLESGDLLVDEVDDGFYVVKSQDDKSAVFIPRSVVSLAFFGSKAIPFNTIEQQPH